MRAIRRSAIRLGSAPKPLHAAAARRRGFTLFEVLLTTVLSAGLLAGVWSLYSIYLGLFETAQARAEQSQLVRALSQQFTDDLHSAIEDSAIEDSAVEGDPGSGSQHRPSGARGRSTSERRFMLLGSRHELRFDVLQVIPLEETPPLDTDVGQRSRTAPTRQVPELRTIFYTFVEPSALQDEQQDEQQGTTSDDLPPIRPGLTRRELDYETPYADEQQSTAEEEVSAATGAPLGESGQELPTDTLSDELLDMDPTGDLTTWIPEVVRLEFRYFDGSGWSDGWDSLERKSLPVAVEVLMQIKPLEESDLDRPETGQDAGDKDPSEPSDGSDELDRMAEEDAPTLDDELARAESGMPAAHRPQWPIHRLVIDLPSANRRPALKRPAAQAALRPIEAPAPLPVPRAAIPRPVRRPPAERATPAARLDDQWIRSTP